MPTIDFITLSRKPENVKILARSIELAMGKVFSFTLTVVDGNHHDLFNGYNFGASKTTGDILVFVHDDAQFLGNPLTFGLPFELLQEPATGFIGVVGARFLGVNGTWWGDHLTREHIMSQCRGMILNTRQNEFGMHSVVWPGGSGEFGQVMVIDGVLLMCHRRTFVRIGGFDADHFGGFHFYDLDTTFRAHLAGLKNYVAPMPVLHQSQGKYDEAWEKNRQIFAEKHKAVLPCSL